MQLSHWMAILMNITSSPQFHLYLLTLHFLRIKNMLLPKKCNERCVDATIINRAYYSSYLYCQLWLEKVHGFKVKHPWEFKNGEKRIGEHKQVKKALHDFGEEEIETSLRKLAKLRNKANYHPNRKLTSKNLNQAINHMEKIFNKLKFD